MARGLRGALRRGLAATMVTGLATFGAVALTAAPASAHTTSVKGTAECVDGQYVVAWTVTNQDKDHDASLEYTAVPGDSDLTLADAIDAGDTIEGTQVLPAGSHGVREGGRNVAKLKVHGEWKDGDKVLTDDEQVSVPLPGESCEADSDDQAEQSATIELSCDVFKVTLKNDGRRKANFTLAFQVNDKKPVFLDYTVKGGETEVIDFNDDNESEFKAAVEKAVQADDVDSLAVAVLHRRDKLASADLDFSDCADDASASASAVADAPSVSEAADAGDSLPVTGASLTGLIAAAVLVLGLGVGMVVLARRRKRA